MALELAVVVSVALDMDLELAVVVSVALDWYGFGPGAMSTRHLLWN